MDETSSPPQDSPVHDQEMTDLPEQDGESSHPPLQDDDANMEEEDLENEQNDKQDHHDDDHDNDEDEDASSAAAPNHHRPKDPRSRKRRWRDKMFQDVVSIHIPLELTADLGIAIRRTRAKRLQALTQAFPELVQHTNNNTNNKTTAEVELKENPVDKSIKGDTTTMDADDEEEGRKSASQAVTRKLLSHVPRRDDYANIVDYLEAKYTQGVMLPDDDEGQDQEENDQAENGGGKKQVDDDEDDDEGQGSVYSQSSFLDDRDLQRHVAEQVLAQSTTTKLELESNIDDAFFVNVGNLEVEESELTREGYDPIDDVENVKKPKKKRKLAEPNKTKTTNNATASPATAANDYDKPKAKKKSGPKPATTKEKEQPKSPAKKKAGTAESSPPKKKAKPNPKKKEKKPPTEAEKAAAAKKKEADKAYKEVLKTINTMTQDDLPRRKTKEKVAITCPADKKPGDSILFANPHVPGQRLKVKIPPKTAPGGTFKVSVPVPIMPDDDENENTDHNKWSREFYDCFGDYCNLYDEWVELVAEVKKEQGVTDFVIYFEKRNKFDELIKDVPQDLKTPLDKSYFQKLLRRARQNRHKRERTQKRQEEKAKELLEESGKSEGDPEDDDDDDEEEDGRSATTAPDEKKGATDKVEADHHPSAASVEEKDSRTVLVPHLSTEFPVITMNLADW